MASHRASDPRRRSILEAALKSFAADGYDGASIEEICDISGASVGSLYHHFGSKEGLAAAVYEEGIISYQADLLTILSAGGPPDIVVAKIVRHHLLWVRRNPGWARYLLQMGAAPATAAARPSVRQRNGELIRHLENWSASPAAAGRVIDVPPPTLVALLLGPCHAVARAWLAGGTDLDDATIELIAAATLRSVSPE